jgi:hypothetical protein
MFLVSAKALIPRRFSTLLIVVMTLSVLVCSAVFSDMPTSYWAANWIEQLYVEGVTGGCGTNPLTYCPDNPVSRAQMAVFLVRMFNLP